MTDSRTNYSFADVQRLCGAVLAEMGGFASAGGLVGKRVAYVAYGDLATYFFVVAMIGAGATVVPIHPRLTATERATLLRIAEPDYVVETVPTVAALEAGSLHINLDAFARPAVDEESALAIVFTSGTTGTPKGALLSRRAFRASAEGSARVIGWKANDRWLLCMPLAHVGGLSVVVRCILARKPVVLFAQPAFDPASLHAVIEKERATIASFVPTMMTRMLELDAASRCPTALRAVLMGGAAISPTLYRHALENGWPLLRTYGQTEACSHITLESPPESLPSGAYVQNAQDTSGAALPGTELKIVDEQIFFRTPTLFSGYLGLGPPLLDAEGFFATGDLGEVLPSGAIRISARRTDLIVSGGENVYPREVELALEAVPEVSSAAVFGVPDERWGQVVAALLVPYVLSPSQPPPDATEIIHALRTTLAGHKIPRLVAWVDELPVNGLGKVERKRLLEWASQLQSVAKPARS